MLRRARSWVAFSMNDRRKVEERTRSESLDNSSESTCEPRSMLDFVEESTMSEMSENENPSLSMEEESRPPSEQGSASSDPLVEVLECVPSATPVDAERKSVILELLSTEENFVKDLETFREEIVDPVKKAEMLPTDMIESIFFNLTDIIQLHRKLLAWFHESFKQCMDRLDEDLYTMNIGEIFLERFSYFDVYREYCSMQGRSFDILKSARRKSELFHSFLEASREYNVKLRRNDIASFMVMPMQRLTRYPLILKRILKHTPEEHQEHEILQKVLETFQRNINDINEICVMKDASAPKRLNTERRRVVLHQSSKIGMAAFSELKWDSEYSSVVLSNILEVTFEDPTETILGKTQTVSSSFEAVVCLCNRKTQIRDPDLNGAMNRRSSDPESGGSGDEFAIVFFKRSKKTGLYSMTFRKPFDLKYCLSVEWNNDLHVSLSFSDASKINLKGSAADLTWLWFVNLQYALASTTRLPRRRNAMANVLVPSLT